MEVLDKNMNITTISGLNSFIDNDIQREAEECVDYFKQFLNETEGNRRRSRRREEAYIGWPLINEKQVQYVLERLDNVKMVKKDGIFLIKLVRK